MRSLTGGGQYVAVGDLGAILTSPDGAVWSRQVSGTTNALNALAYGNGGFVAVGTEDLGLPAPPRPGATNSTPPIPPKPESVILTSGDGVTWTSQNPGVAALNGITYANGQFVAVGGFDPSTTNAAILTSPDGVNWTHRVSGTDYDFSAVAYGTNGFVAVGADNAVATSSDGAVWSSRQIEFRTGNFFDFSGLAYGANLFVGMPAGAPAAILTSPEGVNWMENLYGVSDGYLNGIVYGHGQFVVVGQFGTILSSSDGLSWTTNASGTFDYLNGVASGDNGFVAVGKGGAILQSSAGAMRPTLLSSGLGRFTLSGPPRARFSVQVSTNLARWVNLTNIIPTGPVATFVDPAATTGSQRFYRVLIP